MEHVAGRAIAISGWQLTLYWSDRNSKWHSYDLLEPTPDLSAALAEIDDDPTAIFWG